MNLLVLLLVVLALQSPYDCREREGCGNDDETCEQEQGKHICKPRHCIQPWGERCDAGRTTGCYACEEWSMTRESCCYDWRWVPEETR